MKIKRTLVQNFRGVRQSLLNDLNDVVVLAGQNGSGKSCILDAIRLVKSVYGGYQQNEFHQWFGEFQINFSNDPRAFTSIFNDQKLPLVIEIDVEIHQEEREYLKNNADLLITSQAWKALVPELYGWRSLQAAPFTAQFRSREAEVMERAAQDLKIFWNEIDQKTITARVSIEPNNQPKFNPSKVLEIVFSTFDPAHFGIIDYHGPHRNYGREAFNNINVNVEALEEQRKQSALYNYNMKYTNVKNEMASLYVREALAAKSGHDLGHINDITATLRDLFATFFPDKEFLGPQPTREGGLRFPVRIGNRESHDLDELSSGEKEILYGYLRLRSSAPRNSVILLDEPELHLNPRLTRNLPDFYYRHLATALGNQIWLITHSDAILRESVGKLGFSVFHISPSAYSSSQNQARHVQVDEDLERAVIDLVGDLATYNPGGRVVIFEGEDSDFDLQFVSELFPELVAKANLISGTNKSRVRGLHSLLENLSHSGRLPKLRVYSVTDRDTDPPDLIQPDNRLHWDVYHIENYLLEPVYIAKVLYEIKGSRNWLPEHEIEAALRRCAEETMPSLVTHQISQRANSKLLASLSTRFDPNSVDITSGLVEAIRKSIDRMNSLAEGDLSFDSISQFVHATDRSLREDLTNGDWKINFRGRDILKRFAGKHAEGIKYIHFRNFIISRMRDDNFRPVGMDHVMRKIMQSQPIVQ